MTTRKYNYKDVDMLFAPRQSPKIYQKTLPTCQWFEQHGQVIT